MPTPTVAELKDVLRKAKLPVSGKKADLIKRIIDAGLHPAGEGKHDEPTPTPTPTVKKKKKKKIGAGAIIVKIHINTGGDPKHPTVKKVVELADSLPKKAQDHIVTQAKKFPTVQPVKPLSQVPNLKISAKAGKLQEEVMKDLKSLKKSKGLDAGFKSHLESMLLLGKFERDKKL